MEEIRDADGAVQKRSLLDALHPLDHLHALLAQYSNPGLWILRSFPLFLPRLRDRVFEKRRGFSLNLRRKHFRSLEHLDDSRDTFVHEADDFLDRNHLHVHKLVNWVGRSEFLSTHANRLEDLDAEDILPELKQRSQLLCPLLFVKAEIFFTHGR